MIYVEVMVVFLLVVVKCDESIEGFLSDREIVFLFNEDDEFVLLLINIFLDKNIVILVVMNGWVKVEFIFVD